MSQALTIRKNLASVGEEIPHELGATMIKDYQTTNPGKELGNYIGREIIEKILAQPGCVGINFYNGINEVGRETLVYVGVDKTGSSIFEYSGVDANGRLVAFKGIVADRSTPPPPSTPSTDKEKTWWEYIFG
jgi:hypothetical protein